MQTPAPAPSNFFPLQHIPEAARRKWIIALTLHCILSIQPPSAFKHAERIVPLVVEWKSSKSFLSALLCLFLLLLSSYIACHFLYLLFLETYPSANVLFWVFFEATIGRFMFRFLKMSTKKSEFILSMRQEHSVKANYIPDIIFSMRCASFIFYVFFQEIYPFYYYFFYDVLFIIYLLYFLFH